MAYKYSLRCYTRVYAPWKEGQDEPEVINEREDIMRFDHIIEMMHWLDNNGFTQLSSSDRPDRRTWVTSPIYIDPYTGEMDEVSAHAHEISDREWAAVLHGIG